MNYILFYFYIIFKNDLDIKIKYKFMNSELTISQYTEKSFVVRGNTKENKEQLKAMNGKYNSMLKGGPGWIFPNGLKKIVETYIATGNVTKVEFKNKTESKSENVETEDVESVSYDKRDKIDLNKEITSKNILEYIKKLELRVEYLEEKIETLCKDNGKDKDKKSTKEVTIKETENDEEEEESVPRKRLLR